MPPSDHYCIETVAPSGDHHGIDRVVPSSDHCCTETVALSRLEFTANRVCISQSSDSERARDQWQCAAVTPQVNLSISFVSCVSKRLIEFIAIELIASRHGCLSHSRFHTC